MQTFGKCLFRMLIFAQFLVRKLLGAVKVSGFSAFSVLFTNVLLSAFFSAFNAFFGSFLGFHAKSSKGKQNLEKSNTEYFLSLALT